MYKKILVPLDNSELGEKILPQVIDLAESMKAEVVLLTVGNFSSSLVMNEIDGEILNRIRNSSKKIADEHLAKVADALQAKGLKISTEYREGDPAVKIIQGAQDLGCDLIAMATHGCGEIAWVRGSVAEKVAPHANVPVLLMRVLDEIQPEPKDQPIVRPFDPKLWGE